MLLLAGCNVPGGQDLVLINVSIMGAVEGETSHLVSPGDKLINADGIVASGTYTVDIEIIDVATNSVESSAQLSGNASSYHLIDGNTASASESLTVAANTQTQAYLTLYWSAPPLVAGIDIAIDHVRMSEFRSLALVPGPVFEEGDDLTATVTIWDAPGGSGLETVQAYLDNDAEVSSFVALAYTGSTTIGSDTIDTFSGFLTVQPPVSNRILMLEITAFDSSSAATHPIGKAVGLLPTGYNTYQHNDAAYILSVITTPSATTTDVTTDVLDGSSLPMANAEVVVWEHGNPQNRSRGITDSSGSFTGTLNNKPGGASPTAVGACTFFFDPVMGEYVLLDVVNEL